MYKVELTLKQNDTPAVFYLTDNVIVRTFKTQSGCSVYINGWWDVEESQEEVISKIDYAIQNWVEYTARIRGH